MTTEKRPPSIWLTPWMWSAARWIGVLSLWSALYIISGIMAGVWIDRPTSWANSTLNVIYLPLRLIPIRGSRAAPQQQAPANAEPMGQSE